MKKNNSYKGRLILLAVAALAVLIIFKSGILSYLNEQFILSLRYNKTFLCICQLFSYDLTF